MDREFIGRQILKIRNKIGISQDAFAVLFNSQLPPGSNLYTTRNDIAKYECGLNSMPAEKFIMFQRLDPDHISETDMPMGM